MKRKMPLVKQVMSAFPYTIDVDAPLSEARSMMEAHGIRHLPVMSKNQLFGVVSSRDLTVIQGLGAHPIKSDEFTVATVCSRDVYTADTHETVAKVVLDMAERHIGAAIIMHADKVAGIFTTTDACRVLGEHLHELYGGGSDEPEVA